MYDNNILGMANFFPKYTYVSINVDGMSYDFLWFRGLFILN